MKTDDERSRTRVDSKTAPVSRTPSRVSPTGQPHEGSDEKALTPEELKAKNEAEEKASQARRAEAAKRMAAEREAVGSRPAQRYEGVNSSTMN